MSYWLMKSEPEVFGIDDLERRPNQTEPWDGVRNYQARNMIRDAMRVGDQAFFYHSNCAQPGIVGIVEIASAAYPDRTAFDKRSEYYDPKSDPQRPRWFSVDVRFKSRLKRCISLAELKSHGDALGNLALLRRGNRLSILPVTREQWRYMLRMQ